MHRSTRLKVWALSLVLAAGCGVAGAQTSERTLANGMKVIVIEDHRAPTVVQMVWYRAGSLDEVNGRTGVAHLLEHLMFKGTKTVPEGEFSRLVAAMGGRENAFTSRGYTGYFQQIPRERLADVMRLEADRMSNLVISRESFDKEKQVVMEERRWRTEDRARSQVREQLMAAAFVSSPARTPVSGWMSDLESMALEDAREWYGSWYTPPNAVLVVAGDVVPGEAFALAEQIYGAIPPRPLPARKPQVEPPQAGVRRVWVKAPADVPYVLLGFRAPTLRLAASDDDAYALEVLSAVLAGGDTGRLTREVVRAQRVANSAWASYDMIERGPVLFEMGGTPADGRGIEEVERALRDQVRRIAEEGVPDDELQRVKTQYVAGRVYKRDSVYGQAMEAAGLEIDGFSWRDEQEILDRIGAVGSDRLREVARRWFDEDSLTVVTLLPQRVDEGRRAGAARPRH
jgi:zinc protease